MEFSAYNPAIIHIVKKQPEIYEVSGCFFMLWFCLLSHSINGMWNKHRDGVITCRNRLRWGDGNSIMKEYAQAFYSSTAWKNTREAYAKSKGNLCELCLKQGRYNPCEIVHHRIELSPTNIDNPAITLGWDNLCCVCRECHAKIHLGRQKRFEIDELGRVIPVDSPP